MKFLINSLIYITSILISSEAFARTGGYTSGGGGAFVCINNSQIESAELIDLWEGQYLDQRQIARSNTPYLEQTWEAIEKFKNIDEEFYKNLVDKLNFILTHTYYLPTGISMPAPPDIEHGYEKDGCPASGMMYYDGPRNRLAIRKAVFDKLISETDRAAALFHEAFYAVLRDLYSYRPLNSVSTREMVACLFSTDSSDCLDSRPALDKIPSTAKSQKCIVQNEFTNKQTEFYIWEQDPSTTGVIVTKFDGISVPTGYIGFANSRSEMGNPFFTLTHAGILNQDLKGRLKGSAATNITARVEEARTAFNTGLKQNNPDPTMHSPFTVQCTQ